jgi:hypothetical protein
VLRPLPFLSVVCLAAACAIATGCGATESPVGGNATQRDAALTFAVQPFEPADPATTSQRVEARDPASAALLERVLAGLGRESAVQSVRLGTKPSRDFRANPKMWVTGTTWLYFTVRSGFFCPESCAAGWEATIAAGAYRHLAEAEGLPGLLGFSVTYLYPNDKSQTQTSLISAAARQPAYATPVEELTAEIRAKLEAAVATTGSLDASLSFRRPSGYAPALVIRASDPARTQKYLARHTFFGEVEGFYFELQTAAGKHVMSRFWSVRTRHGGRSG